jgi:hypothetical protein
MANQKITVEGTDIRIFQHNKTDYISLTDIAKQISERTNNVILNWLRGAETLDFLKEWEEKYNSNFDTEAFNKIRNKAGTRAFHISIKEWIGLTKATGITAKAGRFGGTYADKYIAFEFCAAISARFKLYLIDEFERLKSDEAVRLGQQWDVRRELSKMNYYIHSDTVREGLVPLIEQHTPREGVYFASEADLLNVAVFGKTAKEFKIANPTAKGNMRDHAQTVELQVLANMESLNSTLIRQLQLAQPQRFAIIKAQAEYEKSVLMGQKRKLQ